VNCPDEVIAIVLQILREGDLRQRKASSAGDRGLWIAEYNHLCKVSDLRRRFRMKQLKEYLDYAQGPYASEVQGQGLSDSVYAPLWEQLTRYAEQHAA
jgi:hypothetical protein